MTRAALNECEELPWQRRRQRRRRWRSKAGRSPFGLCIVGGSECASLFHVSLFANFYRDRFPLSLDKVRHNANNLLFVQTFITQRCSCFCFQNQIKQILCCSCLNMNASRMTPQHNACESFNFENKKDEDDEANMWNNVSVWSLCRTLENVDDDDDDENDVSNRHLPFAIKINEIISTFPDAHCVVVT